MEYLEVDGRLTPCGFTIRSFEIADVDGERVARSLSKSWRPVTTAAVRALPVAQMETANRRGIDRTDVDELPDVDEFDRLIDKGGQPFDPARLETIVRRVARNSRMIDAAGKRPRYDDEHWRAVAFVYREAYHTGDNPSATVARRYKVTGSRARSWVRRCRELGLLPEADERRARA